MAASTIRVTGIADTLRALDTQLGDNGRLYRFTIRSIKKAGNTAINRAVGFLPDDSPLGPMPSGFVYRKQSEGWSKSRVQGRDRAFPRYDKRAAQQSLRVVSARERSERTDNGWRAGKMFGIAVEMRDPAANIYDVAGNGRSRRQKAKQSTDPRSRAFIGLMKAASWLPPEAKFKVLLPAVIDTRPEIIADIRRSLDAAQAALDEAARNAEAPWRLS